MTKKTWSHR